jgi:hypothetical protein
MKRTKDPLAKRNPTARSVFDRYILHEKQRPPKGLGVLTNCFIREDAILIATFCTENNGAVARVSLGRGSQMTMRSAQSAGLHPQHRPRHGG